MAIDKRDLSAFIDGLIPQWEVVAPVPVEFKYAFRKVGSFQDVALDYTNTMLPPKKFLLPQRDELFSCNPEGGPSLTPRFDETPRVLFGVHSCDVHGIWLLDDILAEGCSDPHYLCRRSNTLIIGLDCKGPCHDNAFCKDMGTLKPAGGFDLFLTDLGERYAVQVGTGAGTALAERGGFYMADFEVREEFFAAWQKKQSGFPNRIGYDTAALPNILAESYDDIIWEALEMRCFDCGACTTVCPTCYCFDVLDENDIGTDRSIRYRRWDSCQLQDFAAVAGGANFRGKRSDRLRHRLLRKGKYFKEKFGRFACVGCGRCGRSCLLHIDVRDVFNQLKG
ncbi:MAG: 4Fe-4S dicluster domain-containing protein [Nitrospirae bacterium]|nr:4Fe-4S dicluster domain-containing protein [Nitrospirota bacterium]